MLQPLIFKSRCHYYPTLAVKLSYSNSAAIQNYRPVHVYVGTADRNDEKFS